MKKWTNEVWSGLYHFGLGGSKEGIEDARSNNALVDCGLNRELERVRKERQFVITQGHQKTLSVTFGYNIYVVVSQLTWHTLGNCIAGHYLHCIAGHYLHCIAGHVIIVTTSQRKYSNGRMNIFAFAFLFVCKHDDKISTPQIVL